MLERIAIQKKVVAFALGVLTAMVLAIPLKGRTLEPSTMFLLGFGLIALRIFISRRLNKMKQLPVKAL